MHKQTLDEIKSAIGDVFQSLYLVVSLGSSYALPTSDVDYICITRRPLEKEELSKLFATRDGLRTSVCPYVDIRAVPIDQVINRGLGVKREGQWLGGEDIRERIQEPPKEVRDKWYVEVALMFLERVHSCKVDCASRVSYPDESDEFYGFCDYQNEKEFGLLMSLSFLATAWLSVIHDRIVTNKHELPYVFRVCSGNESPFLTGLFTIVRGKYELQLPDEQQGQDEIRAVCAESLDYERKVLDDII